MPNVSFIGSSAIVATNGSAPGAVTPNASTSPGDLMIFYHSGKVSGVANKNFSLSGWNLVVQSQISTILHMTVYYRIREVGDTSYTATVSGYTSGNNGESIVEWIETFRNHDATNPIGSFTSPITNFTSGLNVGPIQPPSDPTLFNENMVVVFGGRIENITGQTLLTGDNLTWNLGTRADTTLGSDTGAVTQMGVNGTGITQTVTQKTITTTGTAGYGQGQMFIINAATVGGGFDPMGMMGFYGL